ncbi:hypothetical protein [Cellulomonas aerilata]|uniref:hypothetical protein n=1 Tax=Cellulomonas aerilata TaxID=515326 RepID=UPI0011BE0D36|nr:hypothetical protein [Cellulomonas aerilata]
MTQSGGIERLGAAATVAVAAPSGAAGGLRAAEGAAAELPAWVDYVTVLGPVIVLTGALTAAVLAWSATRRDRWWARTQWAVDHVLGDQTDAQLVGLAVLEVQVRHARSDEEAGVIGAVSDTLLEPLLGSPSPADGDDSGHGVGFGEGNVNAYVVRPARPRVPVAAKSVAPPVGPPGGTSPAGSAPIPVSAMERDAARLRTRVDAKLGRASSATVQAVARAGPG